MGINDNFYLKEDGLLYINPDYSGSLDTPYDIEEIYCEKLDIDFINKLSRDIKKTNNIKKIIIPIYNVNYNKEDLEKIEDKDCILFNSIANLNSLTVDDLIELENIFDLMVKDIKSSNLSPYEKYIAVYNIVKSFKSYEYFYKDKEKDNVIYDQSRNIYLIMINDYMVCAGYANLLKKLLSKVGINSSYWEVQTNNSDISHVRNYIHLIDEKYNIDGFYMCDPTWDNTQKSMMNNGYKNLNLTTTQSREDNEFNKSIGNKETSLNDDFFCLNDEEMYNYIQDNNKYKYLLEKINDLDKNFYKEISNVEKVDIDLAKKINHYFKTKINKPINENKTLRAILEIYQFIFEKKYNNREYNEVWNKLIFSNLYSKELLKGIEVKEDKINISDMKVLDYINFINNNSGFLKYCYQKSYNQYISDNNLDYMRFMYTKYEGKYYLYFRILIDKDIKDNEVKLNNIIYELKNKGYNVNYNEYNIDIVLDDIFINKTFNELYNYLEIVSEDYKKLMSIGEPKLN